MESGIIYSKIMTGEEIQKNKTLMWKLRAPRRRYKILFDAIAYSGDDEAKIILAFNLAVNNGEIIGAIILTDKYENIFVENGYKYLKVSLPLIMRQKLNEIKGEKEQ